ncbi:MAG TPA: enoyl-CoA hydratase/isomerase family protein [Nevskiaceae bacterium]|nr:enoyl-CoA hydratase/isomerase family protein [Nevskiaceae bacterium]
MSLWTVGQDGGVAVAVYRHPPMNYFCADGARELAALIEQWKAPAVRAVVLTGNNPGRFITHYSVEELEAFAADRAALRAAGTMLTDNYHAMLLGLRSLPKPVIVGMNGDTMGGGFELSLACDIRVGQRGDFRYGLPESKLGILPGGSGTQRLTRLLGAGRAIEFILRGRVVKPDAALAMGLVHELVDDAAARAREIGSEVARLPPVALAQIKRAVYEGADLSLAEGLKVESEAFLQTMLSEDALTAMRAYVATPLEKRRDFIDHPPPRDYAGR